jgi:uncharacterized protein (DUF302 family)
MNNNNTITRPSQFTVKETMDKLEAILKQKSITVYARIDQQAEAAKAGIKLHGLEFLLFGNPQKGGLVMAENPEAALDLPLKVLVWEDQGHTVWVTYNNTEGIMQRFSLKAETAQLINIDPLIMALLKS